MPGSASQISAAAAAALVIAAEVGRNAGKEQAAGSAVHPQFTLGGVFCA